MILILLLLIFLLCLIGSWIYLLRDSKSYNIPGPMPLPIIGNGNLFLVDSSGNNIKYRNDNKRKILLFLTTLAGRWASYFDSFLPVFLKNEKILSEQLKRRADGSLIELFPIFALAALDNIAESIMGVSFEAQKDRESKYVKAIDDDVLFALTPYKRLQDKALAVLHNHTKDVIEMRRQQLKNTSANKLNQNSEIGMKNKHAFLDLLLLAEVEGHGLDIESIRDEVETFMFEGHDTTASGLVYGLYCIAKHPEVQRKILEEQMEILGDDLERDPTFSELQQMKYLECVIKESLRLYPSVPIIERLITRDVGQKFAMLELKVTLAALVRRFKILPGKREPQPCGDLILRSQNGVQEVFLPDHALVVGRFMLAAWELGLEGADDEAADLIVVAVQNFLKNVITAVLSQRKGYKLRNKHFMYDVGGDMPNMWLRNSAKLYDPQNDGRVDVDDAADALGPRCPPTIDEVEHSAAFEIACSAPMEPNDEKLTIDEFYNTLLTHRNVIASHSVYAVNMERLAVILNHPSY
ncbi:hypothetical protein MSG28_001470 [Choristoneura fumiferana]|uniref:Uncharacterized protein n=1 Tax=Choristoneura fumiferana TaxID=7141 RepID=A0ACC0KTV3_CHOFU|nr:hypothetical protein MSG28_001470 [Choristoneura fumiferana]